MSNFALDVNSDPGDIISSLNYALANLGSSITAIQYNGNIMVANTATGVISSITNTGQVQVGVIQYLYGYVDIKYANSSTGGSGFTSNATMANYYGVHNAQTPTIDNNPVDYQWTQVSGGFGTTKNLYYTTAGGGQISFYVGTTQPNQYYIPVADNTPILLASLANNIVETTNIVPNAVTQTIAISNNTGYQTINWVNGGNTNPASTDYLWPSFTRGFAIGGGATIIANTSGSTTGSTITVNYNALINSASNYEYNLVELWKSGASAFYKDTFTISRTYVGPGGIENFYIPGNNGALFAGNTGNIIQVATGTTNNLFDGINLGWAVGGGGSGITAYSFGQNGTVTFTELSLPVFVGNLPSAVTYAGGTGNAYPLFNMYGSSILTTGYPGSLTYTPTIIVGSSGYIGFWRGSEDNYANGTFNFETSGTFADLFDIGADLPNNSATDEFTSVNYVAVGSGGTLLYNTRTYGTTGNITSTTGWSQAATGITTTLNAVASNYVYPSTRGNLWVVVGAAGTVLTSTTNSGPWVSANVIPTTQNLNAVAYSNGYWVAVGDAGTIITSTDGSDWTGPYSNPASGIYSSVGTRNLYGIAGGELSNIFVVSGEEIILTSTTANVATTTWSNTYIGGASYNSTLTRLQYQGSWANVANVSLPPANQRITNGQVVSGTYIDTNYTSGQSLTYYLVVGNMYGNVEVTTNGPNLTITELKR